MQSTSFTMHRVKLYKLSLEGKWEDKGTGHISVEYMEQAHAMGLVVISEEESGKTLLVHKITRGENGEELYTRSGGSTIITWHDPEFATDIAISFQEPVGCDHIWTQIRATLDDDSGRHAGPRKGPGDDYDAPASTSGAHMGNGGDMRNDHDSELPPPERGNLEAIAKMLLHVHPTQRDRIAQQLMRPNYLPTLLDQFKKCEDLDDTEGLGFMYSIVRCAIMLNDSSVLEEMLREEHVMDVLGALEYDPDLKQPQKHREFLQSHVRFKEVVTISSPQILAKIHQTYRIQYLKDVILPRSLDDATYATLSSLALFNNMEVVGSLMGDATFLPQLFARLQAADTSDTQWHDLVAFLQEFCNLARHLQPQQRSQLFGRLISLGIFDVVTRIMLHSNDEVKLKASDVLMSCMQHDVQALRTFLFHQPDHTLFHLLANEVVRSNDCGLAEQVCEVIKMLFDPDTMDTPVEKNEFIELFYDKFIGVVLDIIEHDAATNPTSQQARPVSATTLGLLVELLCFCVQNHNYRIKYLTLRQNMVGKVLRILRRKERWLACAAVRLLRTCVSMKDEFFTRYLLRNRLFDPVMIAFFENGDRYNLLNSCVLELLDFITKENMKPILEELVKTYGHRFDDVTYCDTFRKLRLRHEQGLEGAAAAQQQQHQHQHQHQQPASPPGGRGLVWEGGAAEGQGGAGGDVAAAIHSKRFVIGGPDTGPPAQVAGRRRRRDERDMDQDEEDYFSLDDEDHGPQQQRGAGGAASPGHRAAAGGPVAAEDAAAAPHHHHHHHQQALPPGAASSTADDSAAVGPPPPPRRTRVSEDDDDEELAAPPFGGGGIRRFAGVRVVADRVAGPRAQLVFRHGGVLAGNQQQPEQAAAGQGAATAAAAGGGGSATDAGSNQPAADGGPDAGAAAASGSQGGQHSQAPDGGSGGTVGGQAQAGAVRLQQPWRGLVEYDDDEDPDDYDSYGRANDGSADGPRVAANHHHKLPAAHSEAATSSSGAGGTAEGGAGPDLGWRPRAGQGGHDDQGAGSDLRKRPRVEEQDAPRSMHVL